MAQNYERKDLKTPDEIRSFKKGRLELVNIGGGANLAVGAAIAARLRGSDRVALCFFGDGAANRGPVHEASNLAAVWKLPVIFFCENNQYAISVPLARQMAVPHVADRAAAYNVRGQVVA